MRQRAPLATLLVIVVSAAAGCGRSVQAPRADRTQLEATADAAFTASKWYDANALYTELLFDYPGAADTDLYLYRLAVSCARQRMWPEAEFNLGRVIDEYPHSDLSDEASLELARVYWDQRRDYRRDQTEVSAALDKLVQFAQTYPGSDLLPEANLLADNCRAQLAKRSLFVGRFYARRNLDSAALLYYREALDDYGGVGCTGQILMSMGELYMKSGNAYSCRTTLERALAEPDLSEEDRARASEMLSRLENM